MLGYGQQAGGTHPSIQAAGRLVCPRGGGLISSGGVCLPGGCVYPGVSATPQADTHPQTRGRHTPCEQND